MALGQMLGPFIWGEGGTQLTPQQVARERELAQALLARGVDTSPVGHWTQGAARLVNAFGGNLRESRAEDAERLGLEQAQARIDPLIAALTGGGSSYSSGASPVSSYAPSRGSGRSASVPTGERAGYIRKGLIDRGLQPHVADAFLLNFQDESGLNPDINEAAPIVPGSRGGYGLYQLTGPRRRAYEAYASERGVPTSDIDAQLDFLMHELQGPESRAAQSILGASNVNDAAVSIVRDFLRPAEEHRDRRIAEYMAYAAPEDSAMAYAPQGSGISNADLMGGTALDAIDQVAPQGAPSGLPETGSPGQIITGPDGKNYQWAETSGMAGATGPQGWIRTSMGGSPEGRDPMAMALQPQQAPMQVAQAGGGGNDLLAAVLAAQADPWAQQQYGGMLNSLLGNELNRINQANDPLRQLQIQQAQLQLEQMQNPWTAQPASPDQLAQWGIVPQPGESWTIGPDGLPQQVFGPAPAPEPIEVGGVLVDPVTYQPIFDSRTPDTPAAIQEYEFYSQQAVQNGQQPLPFDQWDLERRGRAASQVNVNSAPPAPPAGFQNVFDEDGRLVRQEIIEGGPAWQQAASSLATAENTLEQIRQVVQDPNLGTAVGIGGILPAIPNTPQAALVGRIEQLQGAAFLQAFESLKGGGQITEIEGRKATEAIARLNRVQTQEDFIQALNDLASVVHSGMNRARETIGEPSLGEFEPFTVNDPLAGNPAVQPDGSPTPTGNQPYTDGTIIENDFGQRMIMRNGQWEMM